MSAQLRLWRDSEMALESETRIALSIRESLRARQLILQVLPPRTVEVVVPKGMRPGTVQSFIQTHRDWIRQASRELIEAYPEPQFRPATIELAAVDETVAVRYRAGTGGKSRFRYTPGELTLYSAGEHDTAGLLRRWLLKQGRARLKPWLLREAERVGLVPRSVQVRLQKTRWGSCSSHGRISLNAALLLVRPELVRYLFVHELCHLRHLSHSKRYWQTVARHEPEFRQLDRRLADCWKHLPAWLTVDERSGR